VLCDEAVEIGRERREGVEDERAWGRGIGCSSGGVGGEERPALLLLLVKVDLV